MALKVPTTTRVCLNCKIKSDANAGKEFHEIFDEVGLELQLPFLVKTFFHIDLNKRDKQHLCDDCVNRLIELYDLDEHAKEASCNLKNETEFSNNEESSKYQQNESGNFRCQRENLHKPFVIDQNNTQVILPKIDIECTNSEMFASTQGENTVEMHKQNKSEDIDITEYENINSNISAPFTHKQNQVSIDIVEDLPNEDICQPGERKFSQDFNISLSSCAIKDKKSHELESNTLMEFIIDDGNQNVKINKQSNTNLLVYPKKLEIEEYPNRSNEKIELLSEIKSETKESIFLDSDQNEFIDESECEEFINSGDSNSLLEELEITKEREALLFNASSNATDFNNIEHIDADNFSEQEDISDETYSVEEILPEETVLTEAYDQVDLNEYLDKVLITKFQDLLLNWEMECKLCLGKYNSFSKLLNHACIAAFEKEQQLPCIIKDCEEHAKDLPTLARHLVLKHYDKLESTVIFGKCPDCKKAFSNVLNFNKHSCCRSLKRITGAVSYCKYCNLNFQSFKRYVFHMQFHLKNHRPKICLLCGDLFNNSKDFFEHTQYKHYPQTAFGCARCDRFYKNIQRFNNHMKIHDDSKYKYDCSLCRKKYTSERILQQHMDICHNNKSKTFQCEHCLKKFGYKSSYRIHIKSHETDSKVQTFICSTCGLISINMEKIKEHIESDNESPCFSSAVDDKILSFCYSCVNCSLDFCTVKDLQNHRLRDSHSDNLFQCGLCRNSFYNLTHMRNHFMKNKECKEREESFPITRRLVCNIGDCQEYFTVRTYLNEHKKRHQKTEENPDFKCQFCQQLHSSKKSLINHVARTHYNANLKCPHCKKYFTSQNILLTHIDKFHSPVECDICLKKFVRRRSFELHMKCVHNNIKRYFCKHCQKGYFYRSQRTKHEKRVHPQL